MLMTTSVHPTRRFPEDVAPTGHADFVCFVILCETQLLTILIFDQGEGRLCSNGDARPV
jgi:hypothetical protein